MVTSLGQYLRSLPGPTLLTGHTGFKGTWMTFLLEHLEVPVIGYSLPPQQNSLFDRANRLGAITEKFADIRNQNALEEFIRLNTPSAIIHMAAQPLVLKSYKEPRETFDINVMGTLNLLDKAFQADCIKSIVIVTTDKVYRNNNEKHSFIETDPLEGKDPYSASKVGAEAVVSAWQQIARFINGPQVISVRAGNVIGGGDYADDRIIPDLIRGVEVGNMIKIRNPASTRPWQHVLEPLVGYILALESPDKNIFIPNINFGPTDSDISVEELVAIGVRIIPEISNLLEVGSDFNLHLETSDLKLNSDLSGKQLQWKPKWSSCEAIELTFRWWKSYLSHEASAEELCKLDIKKYFSE